MNKENKIEINNNVSFMVCAICGKTACGYQDFEANEAKGRLYYCIKHIKGSRML